LGALPDLDRPPVVAVIGMATVDDLYVLDDHPGADTVTRALDHRIVVGGLAGRGAIAAKRLGGATRLLATCGRGLHAEVLRAELESEGVECTWVAYEQPSQHSAVILARGLATRTIIWLPQPMADARAVERVPDVLDGADVALLDCTDETLASAALDECARRGVTTVIDSGSGRPWTRGLLGRGDHVIAPETFALKQTGHQAEQAAVELWGDSCRAVFGVTQGPRGGVFVTDEDPGHARRWEAVPVTAVDSCGAGDTFHGAYAWALAQGRPPAECFEVARWSAALKLTRLGNEGLPTLEQLEAARAAGRPTDGPSA